MEGKNWWESAENWTAIVAGGIEFSNWYFGLKIPTGTAASIAAIIMVVLRNTRTSEPIKQFNIKLKHEQ